MADRITANLPARDLGAAADFYARLGFAVAYRDDAWMILRRGPLELEMFAHPGLDPAASHHSACVRVADVDALHRDWARAGLPAQGIPRLTPPRDEPSGLRICALVDPDGSLLRVLSPIA